MKYCNILLLLLISISTFSQTIISRSRQYEVGIGLGAVAYLGDVQGNKGIGKSFLKDLNPSNTNAFIGVFGAYYPKFMEAGWGMRLSAGIGQLWGADSLIKDFGGDELARKRRNLNFKTSFKEISVSVEYHVLLGGFRPYVVVGLGAIAFRPQTYFRDGWVDVAPLKTENIQYPTTALVIPIGFGFKILTNNHKAFTFEVLHRHTSTDFIDDVSTVYPSKTSLTPYLEELSYRNSGYSEGDQRGDPKDMDNYFTVSLKYSVLLKKDVKYLQRQSLRCPTFF
jgi:hypothetical protein